jgi:predicted alpha-1,6-mannanase (GH76 family)
VAGEPGSVKYYDDNAWLGLDFIAAGQALGDSAGLRHAEAILRFERHGWDRRRKAAHPGGEFWRQGHLGRATAAAAGAEQLALQVYRLTGSRTAMDFARRTDVWLNTNLRSSSGLYWGPIKDNGRIVRSAWTYNQGLMIGNSVLFYQATKDPRYLNRAHAIARATLRNLANDNVFAKSIIFNAIFFENLMRLDAISPTDTYRQALRTYAGDVLRSVGPRGLYHQKGGTTLITQSGVVSILAEAASHPPRPGQTTTTLEHRRTLG